VTDPKPPEDRGEQEDEKWYDRTLYQVLLFAGGTALFGLVLGLILDWYIDPRTSTAKKDLVQALGLITAGVAGAVGIYFTWRSQRLTRQDQEENQRNTLAQLKNAEKQLRLSQQSQEDHQRNTQEQLEQARNELNLTRQGQITERFTRAIDQLGETYDNGEPKLEIRLGGIYALERISKDSPDRDYSTVMEVLTAYVRQNIPRLSKEDTQLTSGTNEAIERRKVTNQQSESTGEQPDRGLTRTPPEEPRLDIKAVLDVVGRRQEDSVSEEYRVTPGFRKVDLSRTILSRADLSRADLREAHLLYADLSGANLSGANLSESYLSRADLSRAYLLYASLSRANLSGANLFGANLFGADLREADLREADLRGANLSGANLTGAQEITNEVLESQTRFLEGATMPDGSKHD
jgi:hypothetical protein